MILENITTHQKYEIQKTVHENPDTGVSCYLADDALKKRTVFIKCMAYGSKAYPKEQEKIKSRAGNEILCLRRVNECTKGAPQLYGSWDDRKKKQIVIVMENKKGMTLREWMAQNRMEQATPQAVKVRKELVEQLVCIMKDISRKYSAIVHRDLKPENIIVQVRKDGGLTPSIIDFGCANMNYMRKVGTIGYQAPEQTGDRNCSVGLSSKTDVFALGQIFYELLLGRLPVIGTDYQKRVSDRNWVIYPVLSQLSPQLPQAERLDRILQQMTAYRLEDRIGYDKLLSELRKVRF